MSARPRALITGITGQDGTYLAELLHSRGWQVFGLDRGLATPRLREIANIATRDLTDLPALRQLIDDVRPDRIYHLAAHHRSSQALRPDAGVKELQAADIDERMYLETNLGPVQAMLSTLRASCPKSRVFLAGSCHMFGSPLESPQSERTPFLPNSFYGVTKVAALHMGRVYREKHDLFCATGILYNHESPLRGPGFVTSRIARAAAAIAAGRGEDLRLGSLDAQVDWGFAGDYVEAMVQMLEADTPEDYIIATGTLHSVRDWVMIAFERLGLDWTRHVHEDAAAHRPVATGVYCGDITKIGTNLGWRPSTSFERLVELVVDHHVAEVAREKA